VETAKWDRLLDIEGEVGNQRMLPETAAYGPADGQDIDQLAPPVCHRVQKYLRYDFKSFVINGISGGPDVNTIGCGTETIDHN